MMKMSTGVVAGVALAGFLATAATVAEETVTKVYLFMPLPSIDVEFKSLNGYTPAVAAPGKRTALERYVTDAVRHADKALTAEVRQAIQASMAGQAILVDAPLTGINPDDKTFGVALAALPFMQRRGVPVTVAVNKITLIGDHEGTVTNPRPYQGVINIAPDDIWGALKSVGRGFANIAEGNTPLTFDGLTNLSYQVQYKVYATATGELLRSGNIGPLTAVSPSWQGSWSFPANEPFYDMICTNGICDTQFSPKEAANIVTDPRPSILPETVAKISPQIKEAVIKSFSDWPDLIAAGQELAARR